MVMDKIITVALLGYIVSEGHGFATLFEAYQIWTGCPMILFFMDRYRSIPCGYILFAV